MPFNLPQYSPKSSSGAKKCHRQQDEVVFINDKVRISACENECPHQGSPMLAGIVKESIISCLRHGWHYNLAGGASMDHPGYSLKTYQVEVVGDDILVDLG